MAVVPELADQLIEKQNERVKLAQRSSVLRPSGDAWAKNARKSKVADDQLTELMREAYAQGATVDEIRAVLGWTARRAPADIRERLGIVTPEHAAKRARMDEIDSVSQP